MIKGLEITNGSIYADDNSDFGYEEFIALLEDNGLSFGGGTRTIFEDEDGNLFDENMKPIEIQEGLKWNVLLVMTAWNVSMI